MKIALFYQSVTGNTKHTAELIQEGIKESGHECDIFNILNLDFDSYADYDLYGFGAPVFAWREPKLMRRFILNLLKLRGKYAFLFCTCGGNAGNYFYRIKRNLTKKGVKVFATRTMYYPSSYTVWRKIEGNNDVIKQKEIDKASIFGSSIVSEYEAIIEGTKALPKIRWNLRGAFLGTISSDTALGWFIGTINLDQEKCTKCGTCAEICPESAITLNPYPIISKKLCTGCCGCINLCPVRALDSEKTREKERYQFKSSLIM